MTLDGIMFDCVNSPPCAGMVRCVRANVSVCPRVSDDFIMHVVVKWDLFEFI